jgi:hypothetical protein
MLMSIWIGMAVLVTVLMAADWYLWEPRYRLSDSLVPGPVDGDGKQDFQLRRAA